MRIVWKEHVETPLVVGSIINNIKIPIPNSIWDWIYSSNQTTHNHNYTHKLKEIINVSFIMIAMTPTTMTFHIIMEFRTYTNSNRFLTFGVHFFNFLGNLFANLMLSKNIWYLTSSYKRGSYENLEEIPQSFWKTTLSISKNKKNTWQELIHS